MAVNKPLEKMPSSDIEKLIDKGARIKENNKDDVNKWTNINLRISVEILRRVDKAVSKRVGINRTGWILETIYEKLQDLEWSEENLKNGLPYRNQRLF